MRLSTKFLIALSACCAWPAIAEPTPEAIAVAGEDAASSADRQWADTFGRLMDGITYARSETELSAALEAIKGNAEVLGVESIELLFRMAERRREELDPLSDPVIADLAEGLGRVAEARSAELGEAGAPNLAGLDAQLLYLDRIEAWCVTSDGCRVEERRRFAQDLAKQMLAQPTFWQGDGDP